MLNFLNQTPLKIKPLSLLWLCPSLFLLAGCDQPIDLDAAGNPAVQPAPSESIVSTAQPMAEPSSAIIATAEATASETAQVDEGPTPAMIVSVPVPTATQPPISVPPFQTLDLNNLPPIKNDLTFVSGNKLLRWSADDQALVTAFEPTLDTNRFPIGTFFEIRAVDFSADGKRAAIVVNYIVPDEDQGDGSGDTEAQQPSIGSIESDLYFVDIISQEAWPIVESVKNEVSLVALSPDYTTVAFTTAVSEESDISGNLFLAPTPANPSQRPLTQLHVCLNGCESILWRQDSELLVFMDKAGVYLANPGSTQPQILLENILPGTSSNSKFNVHLPMAWAPNDRALLILSNFEDGFKKGVLDLPTGQVFSIPESGDDASSQPTNVIWLTDSRLLVSEQQSSENNRQLTIYRVNFDEGSLFEDESYTIEATSNLEVAQFEQLQDGRFVYAMTSTDQNAASSGLFGLVSFSEQPERRGGIPTNLGLPTVWWNNDGSEAIQAFGSQTFLATADGNLFSFQDHAWGFNWSNGS